MPLAPIGICTYSRIEHLKQTVEALKTNTLAKESELHIYSDAPRAGDEDKVELLRDYLPHINGFKKVHLILQEENNMLKNTYGAHRALTREYGQSIFMEDDNITSPHFLSFMNEALQKYESNPQILSIGARVIGAELAKLEAEVMLEALRKRCPTLEMIDEGERIGPFLFWGRRKLPVKAARRR